MAFFSVVVPVYNRAHLIADTLRSVFNQNFQDFEIIVVDDGSTDRTEEVVNRLGTSQLHFFKIENSERGFARNFGIRKAQGKFIVFLDSDDIMERNHLETLHEAILIHPALNFVATKYKLLQDDGRLKASDVTPLKQGYYSLDDFLKGNFLACNFCIRKTNPGLKLFQEDRTFSIMEDWLFLIENLSNDKLLLIDSITLQLRDHLERSMRKDDSVVITRRLAATAWIENHLSLGSQQKRKLRGYSWYFCSIHAYSAEDRNRAIQFMLKAIRYQGIPLAFIILMIKILLGRKIIRRLAQ